MARRQKLRGSTVQTIKLALAIFIPTLLVFFIYGWRYMWVYREIEMNHIETVESNCISVALDHTEERYRNSWHRRIYNFVLGNGTNISVYESIVDEINLSKEALEQQLVTGRTLEFTYVPIPAFSNGAFVLLSVSDGSEIIIDKADIFREYYGWLKRCSIMLLVVFCVSILLLSIPPALYFYRKYQRYKKKQRKKEKKERRRAKFAERSQ